MVISKGLILKGGAGLATASAASAGTYCAIDHFQNQSTIFDQGLIDYLESEGEISFKVTHGTNSDLTNFPDFNGNETTFSVKIAVSTAGGTGTLTDKANGKDETQTVTLRKLNGGGDGRDWTWSCEVKFVRKEADKTINELKDKDLLVKSQDKKGFFNKLAEAGNKELKIKFIENCARERGTGNNREINGLASLKVANEGSIKTVDNIESEKTFHLRKGNNKKKERNGSAESESNLYFKSTSEFRDWFQKTK